MALIAIRAVVNVPAYAPMLGIRLCLRMAVRAQKNRVVRRVRVAVGAGARISVILRKPCVVKRRSLPCRGAVAGLAGRGKARCRVIRIGRTLVIGPVAGVAVRRHRLVVVIHVTACARHSCVRAGQRKRSVVVIERGWNPLRSIVANLALLREPRLRMVRRGRVIEIVQVAGDAGRRQSFVDPARMATGAADPDVASRKRKGRVVVIELRACPRGGCVAGIASVRKCCLNVIWICCGLEIPGMATGACACCERIVSIHVALGALQRGMCPGERKAGGCVVEVGIPRTGVVAALAGLRKSRLHVVGIGSRLEILEMARHA